MGIEIERKFLVANDGWKKDAVGVPYRQGYLSTYPDATVRVRLAGDKGYLTIKGKTVGLARAEFEYPIPQEDSVEMLDRLCQKPLIEKTRYRVSFGGRVWEVDEFFGENAGLVMAEVELDDADAEVALPPWAGREVSGDSRYQNSNLARNPYKNWKDHG